MLSIGGSVAAQNKVQAVSNPAIFDPENDHEGLKSARPPSDSVLDAVLKNAETNELTGEIESHSREQKRQLFEVVRINLGQSSEEDFVVHGKPPMIGADNDWFWIVRVARGKGEVMLFSNGLSLELLKRLTNGYRDIEVSWATAAFTGDRVYRFDGSAYKLFRERTREQRP